VVVLGGNIGHVHSYTSHRPTEPPAVVIRTLLPTRLSRGIVVWEGDNDAVLAEKKSHPGLRLQPLSHRGLAGNARRAAPRRVGVCRTL
jgi:hypothetical protein